MRLLKRSLLLMPLLALAVILVGLPAVAFGRDDDNGRFSARLIGINEVPSINTDGSASLRLTLKATSIDFQLDYHNLSAPPVQAHIHFGQARTNGNVVVFFCGPNVPPAQKNCPTGVSGSVSGTLTTADVLAVPTQGIKAGDLAALERVIREGAAYANIHTSNFASGEIRGQIIGFDHDH
jgi:hypothetical protein